MDAPRGLTHAEAAELARRGLAAGLPPETGRTYRDIVKDNLLTFINLTLVGIGIILVILGLPKDAVLAAGLAVLNGLTGVVQEVIAKRRLDHIALITRARATAIRDGEPTAIDPSAIVTGDVLRIGPGDQIMADGRMLTGPIEVDEALLTGESDPIRKDAGAEVHAGTYCLSGEGFFEADAVGAASTAGSIAAGARAARTPRTPMQADVALVVRLLLLIAGIYLALVLLNASLHEVAFQETVLAAAVVVGIVPSGLFLMITVTYSLAALRLAGRQALVQQVNAVESLSNVDVFCLDKTGTLTANRLVLSDVSPIGVDEADARRIAGCVVASMRGGTKTSEAIGHACGGAAQHVVDEVPFSSERKWSAVALDGPGASGVFVLGAPEMVAPHLNGTATVNSPPGWTERGLRVLLLASSPVPERLHDTDDHPRLPATLAPLAWLGFADELRPNARETLDGFRNAGIQLKIISGDNPDTVAALAKQAGLAGVLSTISGSELAVMSDAAFAEAANEHDVFGRITPDQKERLVRALRERGHYVAMTGDGVNDVLSLKQANLAIAMQSGSQATRAAADIVLLGDSFSALPGAFREGQRIRNGLQSILELFLVRVFAVALIIAGVVVLQASFPFSPGHMTLLTLLTVGIPTFGLAFWATPGTLPVSLFRALTRFVAPAALALAIAALGIYVYYFFGVPDAEPIEGGVVAATDLSSATATARSALTTVMVLTGLILVPFSSPPTRYFAVCEEETDEWRPTILAAAMIPFYVVIMAVPALRDFFGVKLLTWVDYVVLTALSVAWGVALRWIWQHRILDRFLGVSLQEPPRKATGARS